MKSRQDTARNDWRESGAFRVAEDVFRVPLPLPGDALQAVNIYFIIGDGEISIIDSGWGGLPETSTAFGAALSELGFDGAAVRRALITHAHRDHFTFATELRDRHGVLVYLGEHERQNIARVRRNDRSGLVNRLARADAAQLMQSAPGKPGGMGWSRPDKWLTDGEIVKVPGTVEGLTVVHTPGHTSGHVVYIDRSRSISFTGDHVLSRITPSIGYEPEPSASPLARYLGSLRKMLSLPDTQLLPAHGPIRASVHERVHELLDHHEKRLSATLAAVDSAATAYDVAVRLRWTRIERRFEELDRFNQMLAVNETLAHLQVLQDLGRIDCQDGLPVVFAPKKG